MTFADAMTSIIGSSTNDAAKRPAWKYYVQVTDYDASATPATYKLVFKNRAGMSYTYSWSGTAFSTSGAATMDADLLEAMVATDWVTGSSVAFAAAVDGTGTW